MVQETEKKEKKVQVIIYCTPELRERIDNALLVEKRKKGYGYSRNEMLTEILENVLPKTEVNV